MNGDHILMPNEFISTEKFMVGVFGNDWKLNKDYLEGREWVRRKFYDGGKMPSDREVP